MAESKNTKKTSAKKNSTAASSKSTAKKSTTTKKNTTAAKKSTTTKKSTTAAKKVAKPAVVEKETKVVEEVKKPVETKKTVEVKKEKTSVVEVLKANATLIILCLVCLLLIINIFLIVKGHQVKLSNGKEVIASVDGKEITAEELFDSIKETYGTNEIINSIDNFIVSKEFTDTKDAEEKAKEQVKSIKTQYESMGQKWTDVLTNYGYESEQALVDEIKESVLKETIALNYLKANLTDKEIEEYYNKNIDDSFNAKHILIMPDTTSDMNDEQVKAAEDAAYNTAVEVINKLNNGEKWADLVNTYSEDTGSKEKEGLIENFTKGDVVDEFFTATKSLNDGAYTSTPVKSKYGYHIILRVSKTDKEALENMKDELIDEIVSSKLSTETNAYMNAWAEVRKKYNFTINDTVIANYYNKALKGE